MKLLRLILILLACATTPSMTLAATPGTLAYQANLADPGGNPVTGVLAITFRLYDQPAGGTALWTEVQNAVDVDGGNLSVELGSVTPLPRSLFGRQLYLGVQFAGDTEMAPRPALTAAPFAFRAAGTMARTLEVAADGPAVDNGTALLAAIAGLPAATESEPWVVLLDSGNYDLGTARLDIPSWVTLAGQGEDATQVASANTRGTILLAADATIRDLTARNTGIPPTANDYAFAIGAEGPGFNNTVVSGVRLERVTGISTAATGTTGSRFGLRFCAVSSHIVDSRGIGDGGTFAFGMRADCAGSRDTYIRGLLLEAANASSGIRGAYIAGGGLWADVRVALTPLATNTSVYGIRSFANNAGVGAFFRDLFVVIDGNDVVPTQPNTTYEGIRTDDGEIVFERPVVAIERAEAQMVHGFRIIAPSPTSPRVEILGGLIELRARQRASLGPGTVTGVFVNNAAPRIVGTEIRVDCVAGGFNGCNGIRRVSAGTLVPAALEVEQTTIQVGHVDPADSSAQSMGYSGEGRLLMRDSRVRVTQSGDAELVVAVNGIGTAIEFEVTQSQLGLFGTVPENSGCQFTANGGTAEFFGNHLRGDVCGGATSVVCAGNTKRGTGFLAATCN